MRRTLLPAFAVGLLAGCATTQPVDQAPLDRTKMPEAAPERDFAPPPVQRTTLSNGITLLVAENHELPIVGMYLVVGGGSAEDPKGKEGVANLTASLLSRGTTSMDAVALSEAFQFLGTQFGAGSSLDASFVNMVTLGKHLDPSLDLFADMVLHPAFAAEELDRLKEQTLTGIMQAKDRPNSVASLLFHELLYGDVYQGRPTVGLDTSVPTITREDVAAFHGAWYHPNNSTLIVAGDVTLASIQPKLEAKFAGWAKADVKRPAVKVPAAPEKTVLYLHDRPGAPQSQIRVGTLGISRTSEAYFRARVLNEVLGGNFQSRLNLNLREDKGFTYGAYSTFMTPRYTGPFLVGTGVRTDATVQSVQEILKEIRDIGGTRPVTAEELAYFQDGMTRSFPAGFESASDLMGQLADLAIYGLPDDTFSHYIKNVRAQSLATVQDAAKLLDADKMLVVVVGDRATLEAPFREAGFDVKVVDAHGQPVP